MAGIEQRFTSADHSQWSSQSQFAMGRALVSDCSKSAATFGGNLNKRTLFGSGITAAAGMPSFSDVATLCIPGYSPRPGPSQHNGEITCSMPGRFSSRSTGPSSSEPITDNILFLNTVGYGDGQCGPPRNFSEPSLNFPLSSVTRTVEADLGGSRTVHNTSTKLLNESVSTSGTRNSGPLLSTSLSIETRLQSSVCLNSSSRGMKLDPSDFPPILTTSGRSCASLFGNTYSSSPCQPALKNYVSVMSKGSLAPETSNGQINQTLTQGTGHTLPPEFSKQDFPALPGQQPVTSNPASVISTGVFASASSFTCSRATPAASAPATGTNRSFTLPPTSLLTAPAVCLGSSDFPLPTNGSGSSSGIQLLPNHLVANIPKNMICDQFGMLGLLKLIRVGDYDATLNMLAPGLDLSSLHSNWQTPGELYNTFISPCNDSCIGRSQDLDYAVPPEYLIRHLISDRLPDPPVDQLSEETLFWLFYNCCREEVQLVVAKELYQREWRFHKKEQLWLTRVVGANFTTDNTSEQGDYYFWDPIRAQKSTHQMTIQYADLDDAPSSFRLSSGNLSASIVSSVNTSGANQSFNTHPHSAQPLQHFAAYPQQQPHHQPLTNRQQPSTGNLPPNAAPHSTINQLGTPLLSGVSSAAALASLFNIRQQHQSQAVSPTVGCFQPSTLLTRTGTVAPLFAARAVPSATASATNSLTSTIVASRTMSLATTSPTTATSTTSGIMSIGNSAAPSAHTIENGFETEPSVARAINRLPTSADLVGVPSAFEGP